jgi:hypothetical protein
MHGGPNPGAPRNFPRVMGPAWKARDQRQALYKSLGMRWPGGSPRTHAVTLSAIAKAKQTVARNKRDLSAALPDIIKLASDKRSLAELKLSPSQALARVAWKGLEQLDRILSITLPKDDPIEIRENIKTLRLVGDMAVAANRLLAQVGEGGARVQRDTQLAMLLEEIRRDKQLGRLK